MLTNQSGFRIYFEHCFGWFRFKLTWMGGNPVGLKISSTQLLARDANGAGVQARI